MKLRHKAMCCRVIGTHGMEFLFCGNRAPIHTVRNPQDGLDYPVCESCYEESQNA